MKLEINNLTVSLNGKEILKSINLDVEPGEFISLLGASGCGKTTTLKTISGILRQSEGSILIDGVQVDNLPTHMRKTVIVFQDFRLFPHMTISENISFPLKMAGSKKAECRRVAAELLKAVKMEGFEDRHVDTLSGGQQQRVALARALAAKPKVLLLDEPFSGLDVSLRKEMRELVMKLQKEYGVTTILVTHDQEEALSMSDRIAFMHEGRIMQYDKPEIIFRHPVNRYVADYFSEGTYFEGEIANKVFQCDLFKANADYPDGRYKCLVRPFALKINKDENSVIIVVDKVYQGNNYLLKLNNPSNGLSFEGIVPDCSSITVGDLVKIQLEKDKLIFIPEN